MLVRMAVQLASATGHSLEVRLPQGNTFVAVPESQSVMGREEMQGLATRLAAITGQAIELEMAMDGATADGAYPFEIQPEGAGWVIGTRPLFDSLIADVKKGISVATISRRFHDGLVEAFANIADLIRNGTSLNRVCLIGGTFHNTHLLEGLTSKLNSRGFEVFTQAEVPAGDGGLSLGQALIAAHCC